MWTQVVLGITQAKTETETAAVITTLFVQLLEITFVAVFVTGKL